MAGKTVSIFLSDTEYEQLEGEAKKAGATVSRYIKDTMINDNLISRSVKDLAKRVDAEAQRRGTAYEYNVKMMFGPAWQDMGDDGDKRAIGRAWYNYVTEQIAAGNTSNKIGKKDSVGQWYIREGK